MRAVGLVAAAAFAATFLGPPLLLIPALHAMPTPARLLGGLAGVGFILLLLVRRQVPRWVDVPGLVLLLWVCALAVGDFGNANAFGRVPEVLNRLVLLAVTYVIVQQCGRGDRALHVVLSGVLLTGLVGGAVGSWQSLTGYLPPGTPDHAWNRVGPFVRAGTGVTDENYYAAALAAAAIVGVTLLLREDDDRVLRALRRLAWIAVPAAIAGIVFTFSRGGLLNLALGWLVVLAIGARTRTAVRWRVGVFAAILAAGAIGLGLAAFSTDRGIVASVVAARLNPENAEAEESTESRALQVAFYQDQVRRDPVRLLVGFGSAGFETLHGYTMHNATLSALSSGGLLALLAYGALIIAGVIAYARLLRRSALARLTPTQITATIVGAAGGLGWLLQAQTLPGAETNFTVLPLVIAVLVHNTRADCLPAERLTADPCSAAPHAAD